MIKKVNFEDVGYMFDEVELSARTKNFIRRNYPDPAELVLMARRFNFQRGISLTRPRSTPKWLLELSGALEKAGYIYPAFDLLMTFNTNRLYRAVYSELFLEFPTDIGQLDNRRYESLQIITEDEFDEVIEAVREELNEEQESYIHYRYGLYRRGVSHSAETTKFFFGYTMRNATMFEEDALRILRSKNALPAIYEEPELSENDTYIEKLITELEGFISEKDERGITVRLVEELQLMAKSPYRSAVKAQEYLRSL